MSPALAEGAGAAVDGGVEGDAVADGGSCVTPEPMAAMMPAASWPMTMGGMRRPDGAVVAVDVAAADAAGGDLDEDFVRGRGGLGEFGDFEVLVLGEEKSLHSVRECLRQQGYNFWRRSAGCLPAESGEGGSEDEVHGERV